MVSISYSLVCIVCEPEPGFLLVFAESLDSGLLKLLNQ